MLLVEAADRVLDGFPPSLSRKAARALERLGVTPLIGHTVVDVAADVGRGPGADGEVERVAARTVIWAAGVTASRARRRARAARLASRSTAPAA